MEFQHLKTFLAVAREGHLTRASERLHLTQSAVSKQLKALEATLGVTLFERTAAGMTLTAAGRQLLPAAERALAGAAELLHLAQGLQARVSGVLRLGTIVDPETIRLGPLLGTLLERHPQVDVKLWHGISGSVRERLQAGDLDAGFFLGECTEPDLVARPLATERYVIAAPAAWADRVAGADWAALAALPWVGTPPLSSQYALMRRLFGARGLTWHAVVEADQESSMIELARTGVALCLLRERLARDLEAGGTLVRWPGPPIECPLSLLVPRRERESAVTLALAEAIDAVWADHAVAQALQGSG